MTEADVIQPSASIASPGLGLRYIGAHCYAYSGVKTATNVETTYLEFDTNGASYIIAKIQFSYCHIATDDYVYRFYLNDQIVQQYAIGAGTTQNGDDTINLVIPPGTKVKLTAQNVTDTSDQQQIVSLVGRVYGAE